MPSQIGTAVSELLVRHFLKFVLLWVIIILGLAAAFAVTFIMMLIIFHDHQHDECDVPLRIFVWVVITSIAYYNSLHFIIQRYLGYRTDIDTQIPERVVRYGLFCQCCNLLLYITGLVFLAEAKSCQKTAPQLYKAVNLFVSIAVSFSVVCTVNSMYVAIFMYLVRTGHVTTSDAAPQAIKMCRVVPLEEILPERQSNDEEGKDLPECPICMEVSKNLSVSFEQFVIYLFHTNLYLIYSRKSLPRHLMIRRRFDEHRAITIFTANAWRVG